MLEPGKLDFVPRMDTCSAGAMRCFFQIIFLRSSFTNLVSFPDLAQLALLGERRGDPRGGPLRPHRQPRLRQHHAPAQDEELLQPAPHRAVRVRLRLHPVQHRRLQQAAGDQER